jgi:hypothetical protein
MRDILVASSGTLSMEQGRHTCQYIGRDLDLRSVAPLVFPVFVHERIFLDHRHNVFLFFLA